jgi:hypothetical protein
MSQGSSDNNYNYNENYADTFKQGGETVMTPNVFSQNLGQTGGGYSSYGYIRDEMNKEEEVERNYVVNNNDLEIFEDKSNHIEELEVDNNVENLEDDEQNYIQN